MVIIKKGKNMQIDIENIEIKTAVFNDINDRELIMVEYVDITGDLQAVMINKSDSSDFGKKVFERFSLEQIEENTLRIHQNNEKSFEDFKQFLEYRETGKITIETKSENENSVPAEITLETLEECSNETLFRLKLNMFDKEEFQNYDDKEIRSKIRRAATLPELMHHYYAFLEKLKNEESQEVTN